MGNSVSNISEYTYKHKCLICKKNINSFELCICLNCDTAFHITCDDDYRLLSKNTNNDKCVKCVRE